MIPCILILTPDNPRMDEKYPPGAQIMTNYPVIFLNNGF